MQKLTKFSSTSTFTIYIFLGFFISSAVEIPSYFVGWYIMDKWGRRWILFATMMTGGISCICCMFVPLGKLVHSPNFHKIQESASGIYFKSCLSRLLYYSAILLLFWSFITLFWSESVEKGSCDCKQNIVSELCVVAYWHFVAFVS